MKSDILMMFQSWILVMNTGTRNCGLLFWCIFEKKMWDQNILNSDDFFLNSWTPPSITIHYCLDDDDIIKTFFFFNFFISFKKSRSQHQHNFLRYFLINQFFFGLGSVENNQLLLGLHTWKPPQAYFRCIMALWAWQVQKVACTNSITPLSVSFETLFLSRYC